MVKFKSMSFFIRIEVVFLSKKPGSGLAEKRENILLFLDYWTVKFSMIEIICVCIVLLPNHGKNRMTFGQKSIKVYN